MKRLLEVNQPEEMPVLYPELWDQIWNFRELSKIRDQWITFFEAEANHRFATEFLDHLDNGIAQGMEETSDQYDRRVNLLLNASKDFNNKLVKYRRILIITPEYLRDLYFYCLVREFDWKV